MIKKHKIILILITCLFFLSNEVRSTDINFFRISSKLLGTYLAVGLVHELGHAIAAKICYNAPFDIHFGCPCEKPIFKIGPFTLNSLLTTTWITKYNAEKNSIKGIITILSGPIMGTLFPVLLDKFLKKNNLENKALSLFCRLIIKDQILQGFTPFYPLKITDGCKIWKKIGINKKTLDKFNKYSYLIIILLMYSFLKDTSSLVNN